MVCGTSHIVEISILNENVIHKRTFAHVACINNSFWLKINPSHTKLFKTKYNKKGNTEADPKSIYKFRS